MTFFERIIIAGVVLILTGCSQSGILWEVTVNPPQKGSDAGPIIASWDKTIVFPEKIQRVFCCSVD